MQREFRGYRVEVTGGSDEELAQIMDCQLVQNWMNSLDQSIILKSIQLQTKILSDTGEFKYIKLSTVSERHGGLIPRIVILDGKSIALLVVINKKKLALIERPRIATGNFRKEIPNINTDGKPVSPELACQFTKEVFGIEISPGGVVDLIKVTTGKENEGIHPYCGPCDRQTFFYLVPIERTDVEVADLNDKVIGPNQTVKIVNLEDVGREVNDFVTLSGMLFYKKFKERKQT